MLTEQEITNKKLGCVDLVSIALSLSSSNVKYRINDDGSLSIFGVNVALVYFPDEHVWRGKINGIYVQGSFGIRRRQSEVRLTCDQYSEYRDFST